MVRFYGREVYEVLSVKIDPVVVDIVRVFIRVHAAGREPDRALFSIDGIHTTNDPGTAGDLLFLGTGNRIE